MTDSAAYLITDFIRSDSNGLIVIPQVPRSKLSVTTESVAAVEVVVVPQVCQLEIGVVPSVEDLPDGGIEVALIAREEGILEEASPSSDGHECVPRTTVKSRGIGCSCGPEIRRIAFFLRRR